MSNASSELKTLKKDSQDVIAILSSDSNSVVCLGAGLVRVGLLSEEQLGRIEGNNQEKVRLLMKAVEQQVEADPTKFYVFIDILKENRLCRTLVSKLRNSLGKCTVMLREYTI